MKHETVWIERGWQPVAIGFVPSRKAWNKTCKLQNITNAPYPGQRHTGGHTQWLTNHTTGEAIILVTVHDGSEDRGAFEVISTIVHEAVHVWQFLCEHIGEKSPGIEMEAYAIQHIVEGLINAYCETQGKGKDWLAHDAKN